MMTARAEAFITAEQATACRSSYRGRFLTLTVVSMVNFSSESRFGSKAAKSPIASCILVDPCPIPIPFLVPTTALVGAAVGLAVAALPVFGIASRVVTGIAAGIGAEVLAKKLF